MCKLPDTVKQWFRLWGSTSALSLKGNAPLKDPPHTCLTSPPAPPNSDHRSRLCTCALKQPSKLVLRESGMYHSLLPIDMLLDFSSGYEEAKKNIATFPASVVNRNNSIVEKLRILKGILEKSKVLITWKGIPVHWESGLRWFCVVHWMSQDYCKTHQQ